MTERLKNFFILNRLLILTIVIVILFFGLYFSNNRDLDLTLKVAQIIATVLAGVTVFYLAKQIETSVEQEKINRSWDSIKLYTNPDCRKIINSIHVFLKFKRTTAEQRSHLLELDLEELEDFIEKESTNKGDALSDLLLKVAHSLNLKDREFEQIKSNKKNKEFIKESALFHFTELRSRAIFVRNIFEMTGLLYNTNQLNKEIVKGFFKSISLRTYKDLEKNIDALRIKDKQTTLCKEWEIMNKDLAKGKPAKRYGLS